MRIFSKHDTRTLEKNKRPEEGYDTLKKKLGNGVPNRESAR